MAQSSDSLYTGDEYRTHNPDWHEEDAEGKAAQILALLERADMTPASILDVGCGTGGILRALRHSPRLADAEMTGYDISPHAIAIAVEKSPPSMVFRAGVAAVDDGPADLVLCIDVFEHVDDYVGLIRELSNLGRRVIFRIPLDMNLLNVFFPSRMLSLRERLGHLHYFSQTSAIATLQYCGYSVVDSMVVPPVSKRGPGVRRLLMRALRRAVSLVSPSFSVRLFGSWSLVVLAAPQGLKSDPDG